MKVNLKLLYTELRMSCNSDETFTIIEMIEELYKEAYTSGYRSGVNSIGANHMAKLESKINSITFEY